ncbi:lipopolysaccharide assembly protein LapB [Dongshaea marina]|uniref:lipopolysaccharide assembly protein LapB n=1 Tax=Dongshaea marina TaxID=2047966 RepID=UPI000D3E4197|nr:lipopolysaccharide assembly protein LapB [Dongshaea marina]
MLVLLFLLLPIAAGYGWFMGRRSLSAEAKKRSTSLSRQYVAGLNFLLSDQPDKAVDLFIELLKVDSETIETHLALGNLFRRRGEVDRAIRIHQNLIARPSLTKEQRNLAMEQLARDFLAAGLYDRAESILSQLRHDSTHEEAALTQLLVIYQHMRDWGEAIAVAERLQKYKGKQVTSTIAHFYCEQAEIELKENRLAQALAKYKKALSVDKNCVRASMSLAELYMSQDDYRAALRMLQRIARQDVEFVGEIIEPLEECASRLGMPDEVKSFLGELIQYNPGASVILKLADIIYRQQGLGAAEGFMLAQLRQHPTMKGFHQLMSFHLQEAEEGRARESLSLLKELVENQLKSRPTHRCGECGFSTHSLFWLCPSCKSWGTIKPIRGLNGE